MLAKVIMTELERNCGNQMIESVKLKFYMICIDDTLLLAKEDDIHYIFGKFNSFRKNLKLQWIVLATAMYIFWFLDIAIDKIDTDL